MTGRNETRGAALIIAIAVLTILLAIALTFFTVSRLELKASTNVENTVRAELLADGATNIAISFLNSDRREHPSCTSLDHAWRTYFNGLWFIGKDWARRDPNQLPPIPAVFYTPDRDFRGAIPAAGGIGNLYVPRREPPAGPVDTNRFTNPNPANWYNLSNNPYVINPDGLRDPNTGAVISPITPVQQVDLSADIDNDGDGWRDSVWIPLVGDTFSGSLIDEETGDVLVPGDGVDNDLDAGLVLQDYLDSYYDYLKKNDPVGADGLKHTFEGSRGADESNETTVFLYYGGNDGQDNNGDGLLDEPIEDRWFLTAPLNSLDAANNHYVILHQVVIPGVPNVIDINTDPTLPWPATNAEIYDGRHRWVDVLDNDQDLVANKHREYYTTLLVPPPPYDRNSNPAFAAYMDDIDARNKDAQDNNIPLVVLPNLPVHGTDTWTGLDTWYEFDNLRGVQEISPTYLGGNFVSTWRLRSTAEPVVEIVGRAAVLISDEAAKVNLNVAGAHTLDVQNVIEANTTPTVSDAAQAPVTKDLWKIAANSGLGPYEYCTLSMPGLGTDPDSGLGIGRSRKLWNMLMGAPNGSLMVGQSSVLTTPLDAEYMLDASLPGYGLVDDNANAFALAMNGLDDSGDGMVDKGLNPAYPQYLGLFEGVDEPGEYQQRVPYRNMVAEGKIPQSDGTTYQTTPVDTGQVANPIGTLGDRALRTREEVKRAVFNEAVQSPGAFFDRLKNVVTLHSQDLNDRFVQQVRGPGSDMYPAERAKQEDIEPGGHKSTKVDYNYASPYKIADAIKEDWSLLANPWYFYPTDVHPERLETELARFLYGTIQEGATLNGFPLIQQQTWPADARLRALQIAANVRDLRDADYARTEASYVMDMPSPSNDASWLGANAGGDRWWNQMMHDAGLTDAQIKENKEPIVHTLAGTEGIKITEMMVRPVRRVEAEMIAYPDPNYPNYLDRALCPNLFSRYADVNNPQPTDVPDFNMYPQRMDDPQGPADQLVTDPASGYSYISGLYPSQVGGSYWPLPKGPNDSWNKSVQYLGDQTALVTGYREITLDHVNDQGTHKNIPVPNIIQFRFAPGPGLPPGRYYLTVNTADVEGHPTVDNQKEDQMRFAVKYAYGMNTGLHPRVDPNPAVKEPDSRDILADAAFFLKSYEPTDPRTPREYLYEEFRYWTRDDTTGHMPIVGYRHYGEADKTNPDPAVLQQEATGWVFLPTIWDGPDFVPPVDVPSWFPDNPPQDEIDRYKNGWGYGMDQAFTVTIPPYADTLNEQVYLYVAVCMGPDDPEPVASARPEMDYPGNPGYPGYPGYPGPLPPNGIDDDGDGVPDDGPASPYGMPEPENLAHNGRDDDGDGYIDDPPPRLAINFFDFSQEPDHEWIEVENVSGQPVDISGWTVAVGADPVSQDDLKRDQVVMTIPDTLTSDPNSPVVLESRPPNNRVLLAVDARDFLEQTAGIPLQYRDNLLFNNGIGFVTANLNTLPATDPEPTKLDFGRVTGRPRENPYAWPEPIALRGNGIDDDGDGIADDGPLDSPGMPEPYAVSNNGFDDDSDGYADDTRNVPAVSDLTDDFYKQQRIVQLAKARVAGFKRTKDCPAGFTCDSDDILAPAAVLTDAPKDIARLVLRGGVLPDYPEHDGVDNDNDNEDKVAQTSESESVVMKGLSRDGVDTNSNGVLDEPEEGIDEGRYAMDRKRVPGAAFGIAAAVPAPGAFSAGSIQYHTAFFDWNDWNVVLSDDSSFQHGKTYLGGGGEPPEWKEFVERRFFPGDNVIVTLFQGSPNDHRIVDRVTYTERDVINRAIDDGVETPKYAVTGYPQPQPLPPTLFGTPNDYLGFWADNTMAFDFYRTLERKFHPLYNGDRFGTRNRWEATDGNYDDWSHDLVSDPNLLSGTPLARNEAALLLTPPGVAPTIRDLNPEEEDLAYLGWTPLENFDGGAALARITRDWSGGNTWRVQNGTYIGPTTGRFSVYQGPPLPSGRTGDADSMRWKNYRFLCDVEVPVRSNAAPPTDYEVGFAFRWKDAQNHYVLIVHTEQDPTTSQILTRYGIFKMTNGNKTLLTPWPDNDPNGLPGPALPYNRPITMEIKVEGRRFAAIVNGVVMPVIVDPGIPYVPDPAIDEGTVGLWCDGYPVVFDNGYAVTREHNHPFTSAADALDTPYFSLTKTYTFTGNQYAVPSPEVVDGAATAPNPYIGQLERLRVGARSRDDADALLAAGVSEPVRLTCGQATFYLLRPTGDDPSDPRFRDKAFWETQLLPWNMLDPTDPTSWRPPQVWRPVFLYGLYDPTRLNPNLPQTELQDPYQYRVSGFAPADWPILASENFLFTNPLRPDLNPTVHDFLPWLNPARLNAGVLQGNKPRWPIERRAVMYVTTGASMAGPSEALFVWGPDSGIENGEYDQGLYVDLGGDLTDPDRLGQAAKIPPLPMFTGVAAALVNLASNTTREKQWMDIEVFTDNNGDGRCWTGAAPTWNTLDSGDRVNGGTIKGASPDPNSTDWLIHVDHRLTIAHNFLAVLIRNRAPEAEMLNRFAGVILTPRQRTAGRININTVETRPYERQRRGGDPPNVPVYEPFNALMGLPGVLFDDRQDGLPPGFDPHIPDLYAPPENPRLPQLPLWTTVRPDDPTDLFTRARLIEAGRPSSFPDEEQVYPAFPNRWDGRYYLSIDELMAGRTRFDPTQGNLGGFKFSPLSTKIDPDQRTDEIRRRFARLANMITTRSDNFEILVTVQAGYGVDANNDGVINYRNNDEFIVTAEKKARTVYER